MSRADKNTWQNIYVCVYENCKQPTHPSVPDAQKYKYDFYLRNSFFYEIRVRLRLCVLHTRIAARRIMWAVENVNGRKSVTKRAHLHEREKIVVYFTRSNIWAKITIFKTTSNFARICSLSPRGLRVGCGAYRVRQQKCSSNRVDFTRFGAQTYQVAVERTYIRSLPHKKTIVSQNTWTKTACAYNRFGRKRLWSRCFAFWTVIIIFFTPRNVYHRSETMWNRDRLDRVLGWNLPGVIRFHNCRTRWDPNARIMYSSYFW